MSNYSFYIKTLMFEIILLNIIMSITKKLASTFAGVVVALVAFGMMASSASAISVQALMALGLTADQAAVVSALFPAEQQGSTCTPVDTTTVSGVQSAVNELGYMPMLVVDGKNGPATKAGIMWAQALIGTSVDGAWGPNTRLAYNAHVAATCTPVVVEPVTPVEPEVTFPSTSGNEASLEKFKMLSEKDAEEGQMKHVATIEFDVEDGDVLIERLDLSFDNANVTGSADTRPWDVFSTITLKADGKEIAEVDVDRRRDWNRESAPFVFRISGMDYIVEEGDLAEIEVYLTANNTVRSPGSDADWTIYVAERGIRGTDTAGLTQEIGDASTPTDSVRFTVDIKGGDEALKVRSSSNDPKSSILKVETNKVSEWHDIFIYEIEAEENDFDLEELILNVDTTGEDYRDVVNKLEVEVDGQNFRRSDVEYFTNASFTTSQGTTPSAFAQLTFDLDRRVTVDAGDRIDVVVKAEFRQTNVSSPFNYTSGQTIKVSAPTASVEGEGVDYMNSTGTASSKTHTLDIAAAYVDGFAWSVNNVGTIIDFTFDVEADDEDFNVDIARVMATPTYNGLTPVAATLILVGGDATFVSANQYNVLSGDSATFRVRYGVTATNTNNGTFWEVMMTSVEGKELPNSKQTSPTATVNIN